MGVIIWIISGTLIFGCKRTRHPLEADATLQYSGSVAADGCDWLIKTTNGATYHADNLSNDFKTNSLKVHIKYTLLNTKFQCGLSPDNAYPVIHIEEIKRN
ncbi:hypothetical protein GCM10027037_13430 [Mucilaginibacter koreensis]